jgi:ER lumen protein retaining receptor
MHPPVRHCSIPVDANAHFVTLRFFFISGRSQALFAIVFVSRYLDLFTNFISFYNTSMKVFFLAASIGTCYLMYLKFKATYDHNHDTFR